jgi:hypothetical protein
MDPGNQNQNQNDQIPETVATPVAYPIAEVTMPLDQSQNSNTELQANLIADASTQLNATPMPSAPITEHSKNYPLLSQETPQNNTREQWMNSAYKNPTAIDPSKLKDLVGKSYAQTLLYLNLTKQIIKSQLENNTTDTTLIDLQSKIDKSIKELELSTEAKQKLQVNPISEDSSVSIAELLVEIAGLGMAVTAAAGGKRRSKKSKKRRGKSKKRRTRRH